jgi:hypothetical protein
MKLVNITFGTTPKVPGIRAADLGTVELDKPSEALRGWRLILRGQQAFFVSPPGWLRDLSEKRRDAKGPVTIFEMPRTELTLHWQATEGELENVLKGGKWESPPFGWQPAPVVTDKPILAQIPVSQMGD